jgi:VCBS repeat-containing protein
VLETLEQRRLLAAPVAVNDNDLPHWVDEDGVLELDAAEGVLANDTDADDDDLTAIKVSDPAHGTLLLNADGSYRYTPDGDYFGFDSFTYKASDGTDESNIATVTIGVNNVNDAPMAIEDAYTTARNQTLSVNAANGLLKNDADPDLVAGNPAAESLTAVTEFFEFEDLPDHGTLTLNANGSFTYVPETGFFGTDAFVYFVVDAAGQGHGTTVTIEVTETSTQEPPAAAADAYGADEDVKLTVGAAEGVLANDSDPNGEAIVAILFTPPSHGAVTLAQDGGFAYTPAGNFSGTDSFQYRARDTNGAYSAPVTVTVNVDPINDFPIAGPSTVHRTPGEPVNVPVLSFATDPDAGDKLSFEILTQPAGGDAAVDDNGTPDDPHDDFVVYTPDEEEDPETDTFTVRITDDGGSSVELTVTVTTAAPPAGGSAALVANPFDAGKHDLVIQGTENGDVISVVDKGSGDYQVIINGQSRGTFAPTGAVIVSALGGNDRVIATSVKRSMLIYGGVGNDVLRAGSGADVLVGGGGNDRLEGNGGRNILIGGDGRDKLVSTSIGNILIGGVARYENPVATAHRQKLEEILSVWRDKTALSSRVRGIKKGVGAQRARFSAVTISDDHVKDIFTHVAGPDWMLRSKKDIIDGQITADRLMSI